MDNAIIDYALAVVGDSDEYDRKKHEYLLQKEAEGFRLISIRDTVEVGGDFRNPIGYHVYDYRTGEHLATFNHDTDEPEFIAPGVDVDTFYYQGNVWEAVDHEYAEIPTPAGYPASIFDREYTEFVDILRGELEELGLYQRPDYVRQFEG